MESITEVKSGKYTFAIRENTVSRDGELIYTSMRVGGAYPGCINITINYKNNKPDTAHLSHAMYDPECVVNKGALNAQPPLILERGNGSKIIIDTAIAYIKNKYPEIKEIHYDDMSEIECGTEEEVQVVRNKSFNPLKRGTNLKPLPLYYLSIAYNGQTWYEKYFGSRLENPEHHARYRERVTTLLGSKPADFNEFLKTSQAPNQLWNELYEYYKNANTYSEFFHAIPKPERCRILRPWLKAFMMHHLKNAFTNNYWIIPLQTSIKGGKIATQEQRKTRRKLSSTFYVPKGIRLYSESYDLGVTMDTL